MKPTRLQYYFLLALLLACAWTTAPYLAPPSQATAAQTNKTEPLYRFRSRKGYLLYKTRDTLPAGLSDGPWKLEGLVAYVPVQAAGVKPVYQLAKTDQYGVRFTYTASEAEANSAKGGPADAYTGVGNWTNQGAAFYVFTTQLPGTVPLYRLRNQVGILGSGPNAGKLEPGGDATYLTADPGERDEVAARPGWNHAGVLGYVSRSLPLEGPDLTIKQITAEEFSVTAIIANQGKQNTGGAEVWAHLWVVDKAGKAVIWEGKNVGGLSPGQTRPVTWDTKGRSLNGLRYWVKVDDANKVAESNENNNQTEPTEYRRKVKINASNAPDIPAPSILIMGKQSEPGPKTLYRLKVTNWDKYTGADIRWSGNELPPNLCGNTRLQAQIRIIKFNNGTHYDAGCKPVKVPQDLQTLEFKAAGVLSELDKVEVVLVDRQENKTYPSAPYTVGWFGLDETLVPGGCKYFLGRAGNYLCTTDQGFSACEKLRQQGKPIKCTRAGKSQP